MSSTIAVTCGIIIWKDQVLCVQRGENMHLPFKWEFPGGKVESDEQEKDCLLREVKEELNLSIEIVEPLSPVCFQYPGKSPIVLKPFIAYCKNPSLQLNEHINFRWLNPSDLMSLDWAHADIPIVKEFMNWWINNR